MNTTELMVLGSILRDTVNAKAAKLLEEQPQLLLALATLRLSGKVDLTKAEANNLVVLGLLAVDADGYFLSDVVEDAIDKMIVELESKGSSLREAVALAVDGMPTGTEAPE